MHLVQRLLDFIAGTFRVILKMHAAVKKGSAVLGGIIHSVKAAFLMADLGYAQGNGPHSHAGKEHEQNQANHILPVPKHFFVILPG